MAWSMRQLNDGSWSWEVAHADYGTAFGHCRSFPSALVRLTIAESEMLTQKFTPERITFLEREPEELLRSRAAWIRDAIGRNVKPLDPARFLAVLDDHEGVEDRF